MAPVLDQLPLFLAALAVVFLVPGPDMVLVLQTGAGRGRAAAFAAAAGLAVARSAHVGLSALGLAALMKTSVFAFEAVRWAGTAYLVWLGVRILRSSGLVAAAGGADAPRSRGAAFRAGLLTNILNPKALVFCSVLLPQFVHPEAGPAGVQFAVLGAILVATGFAFDALFALVGQRVGAALAGRRAAKRVQRWLFGSVLIGFGLRLAWA